MCLVRHSPLAAGTAPSDGAAAAGSAMPAATTTTTAAVAAAVLASAATAAVAAGAVLASVVADAVAAAVAAAVLASAASAACSLAEQTTKSISDGGGDTAKAARWQESPEAHGRSFWDGFQAGTPAGRLGRLRLPLQTNREVDVVQQARGQRVFAAHTPCRPCTCHCMFPILKGDGLPPCSARTTACFLS